VFGGVKGKNPCGQPCSSFTDQLRLVLAEPVDRNDPQSIRKMRRIAEKLVIASVLARGIVRFLVSNHSTFSKSGVSRPSR
jgi:hypothetical protein